MDNVSKMLSAGVGGIVGGAISIIGLSGYMVYKYFSGRFDEQIMLLAMKIIYPPGGIFVVGGLGLFLCATKLDVQLHAIFARIADYKNERDSDTRL